MKKSPVREIGFFGPDRKPFKIHLTDAGRRDPLTASFGTQEPLEVFHLHAETVELTNEMKLLGRGEFCENQIVRIGERAYGLQGHFELTREMLEVWAAEDPDLQTLRISDLKEGFAAVGTAFREAARRLLSNFLAISPTSRKLRSGTPGNVL